MLSLEPLTRRFVYFCESLHPVLGRHVMPCVPGIVTKAWSHCFVVLLVQVRIKATLWNVGRNVTDWKRDCRDSATHSCSSKHGPPVPTVLLLLRGYSLPRKQLYEPLPRNGIEYVLLFLMHVNSYGSRWPLRQVSISSWRGPAANLLNWTSSGD
jgi:hypothetical protein